MFVFSPVYVDSTSDLELVARRLMWGKFVNSGQTCVAPDYVLCSPEVQASSNTVYFVCRTVLFLLINLCSRQLNRTEIFVFFCKLVVNEKNMVLRLFLLQYTLFCTTTVIFLNTWFVVLLKFVKQ